MVYKYLKNCMKNGSLNFQPVYKGILPTSLTL